MLAGSLRSLMRSTKSAFTGIFASYLYTAIADRHPDPPPVIEIVTQRAELHQLIALLEVNSWERIVTTRTVGMANHIVVYGQRDRGFVVWINQTEDEDYVQFILARHLTIYCCLVTDEKVRMVQTTSIHLISVFQIEHYFPRLLDVNVILGGRDELQSLDDWLPQTVENADAPRRIQEFVDDHGHSAPHVFWPHHKIVEASIDLPVPCSWDCPVMVRTGTQGVSKLKYRPLPDGCRNSTEGEHVWGWWYGQLCSNTACSREGLRADTYQDDISY